MNVIAWLVLGLVAGAIARAIYSGHQGFGVPLTILLGAIGALAGGSLYSLLATGNLQLVAAGFTMPGLIVAIISTMVTIFLWSLMARKAV